MTNMNKLYIRIWFLALLCACFSCSSPSNLKTYRIGFDPSFYPVHLKGKEANVFAFSSELLKEIGQIKKVHFERVSVSWDNLLWGLKENKYEAMISAMQPYNFNLSKYSFSDIFLPTGPVLVVRRNSAIGSLEDMQDKYLAFEESNENFTLLEKYPQIIIKPYQNIPNALDQLEKGQVEGVLISAIFAKNYIQDFFEDQLMIATPPLTDEGLKAVTLREKSPQLISLFNEGLEELKRSGRYKELLIKWNLPIPLPLQKSEI